MTKTARVFRNGGGQAVRLPKGFTFDDDEVCIKRIGSAVLLYPKESAWSVAVHAIAQADDDFMPDRNQPDKTEKRKRL